MFTFISELLSVAVESFDEILTGTPAHQIVMGTAALYFIYNQYNNPWIARTYRERNTKTMTQRIIDTAYDIGKNLPPVRTYLDNELNKNLISTQEKLQTQRSQMSLQYKMPQQGCAAADILKAFDIELEDCSFDFKSVKHSSKPREFIVRKGDGQDSGALYAVHPKELTELLKEVYAKTALINPLHEKWPRINAMQAEIMQWCQDLFHGSDNGYGLLTHGGSTSIIEAMAAYVLHARARGIAWPEIVVPETAHAAFQKAADLTGAKLIVVPVDKKTGAVSTSTMSGYLSGNTCVIVGSAPSYMNGINDPINELGELAITNNIPFHVDACLGGFFTAFLDTSDDPMDFRVAGVTSISTDMHKYGCCPKGTSVCLFSENSPALPVYAALNWSGGLYATPGILDGSTSGARVAEIYTTLSWYGQEEFQKISESIIKLRQNLQQKITSLINVDNEFKTGDIYIFANPKWSLLGFRSDTLNAHMIADEMEQLGWKLNHLQNPDGFHLCLTHVHTLIEDFEDGFVRDLMQAIINVKNYPADKKPDGNVKVYGSVGLLPTPVQEMVSVQYQKARLGITRGPAFFAGENKTREFEQINPDVEQNNSCS